MEGRLVWTTTLRLFKEILDLMEFVQLVQQCDRGVLDVGQRFLDGVALAGNS